MLCLISPSKKTNIQLVRNPGIIANITFSEVVMNVLCEIAWGIIKDNFDFILKKRGELQEDELKQC